MVLGTMKKIIKVQLDDLPKSHTPMFDYCRKLIAEGVDPKAELQVYRGDVLAMKINVGNGSTLTVQDNNQGTPKFRPVRHGQEAVD